MRLCRRRWRGGGGWLALLRKTPYEDFASSLTPQGSGRALNAVTRFLLLVAVAILSFDVPWAAAQNFTEADLRATAGALAKAHAGDWQGAYADLAPVQDPLPHKILRWLDYCRGTATGRFGEITDFIARNPDWPGMKRLRHRAEQAATGEPDATVADWFKRYPPLSGLGKVRAAEIVADSGNAAAGTAALRAAWIAADLGAADERSFYARHGALIRPEDNWARLDRLLWDGRHEAAKSMLPLVDADHRALAEARLALAAHADTADKLVAKVPAALRSDPGLRYGELRWQAKHDMVDSAAQILLANPGDPVQPEKWWGQRQSIVRQVLATGNSDLAWRLANQHGALDGKSFAQAQFLLGYIALRYLKQPAPAFDHFSRILTRTDSPWAKSRAGYWGGRAAAAEGKNELAAKWYAAGAEHQGTFYGQLAAHQLGDDAPPHPAPEPAPSAQQLARFDGEELVRATALLLAAGEREDARIFLLHLAGLAKTPVDFAMLAGLAERYGRTDLAIAVAQKAAAANAPLTVHGYPVTALPAGGLDEPEPSLLLAIVRQESAFAVDAVSAVGARGLMQLMPKTASYIAGKMALPFTEARLTEDGVYNMQLGQAYLQQLIDDFGGSYALAIAAYNAGPGRVRQWLAQFGDPRGGSIDMVDWIELIPFEETRHYVQRVLENLQIYREQRGRNSAYTLVSDLAR
jgi:soluble lytic murein transglycosylase